MCGVAPVVAQHQVKKYTHKYDNGTYYDEVYPAGYYTGSCTWDSVEVPCTFCLRHYIFSDNKEDCVFYIHLTDSNLEKFVKGVYIAEIQLSNNEIFTFDNKYDFFGFGTYDGDRLMVFLDPFSNYREYKSSYRSEDEIDDKDVASSYFYNQLSLYDIKAIRFNESQTFIPQFKSSEYIKSLVAELRSTLTDKRLLPDINNLDRSWAQKKIGVKVASNSDYGYRVTWDDFISTFADPKIDFRFTLLPANGGNRALIDFFSEGYSIPDLLSYAGKQRPMTITLANGVQYRTTKAVLKPTFTSREVNIQAGAEAFVDTRNPLVKVTPKSLLQQLAKYDVVEVQVLGHKIDLRNAEASSAKLFGEQCKVMLEKTGAADLYELTTPAPAVRPTTTTPKKTTTTKPTSTTTKSDAEAIAEADRRAVELMKQAQNKSAKKPTATSNEEPKGVLLPAFNKLKYGRYIARYDHIAPSQLMNTPLALFTSRAIPMDALLEMMDGAKGVGAAKVSETTTGKLVTVQPTEFYCRLRGYEDMPCTTMSVGYDANDARQIKTATFIYNLPASWKRSKVKEYAKAFSEDMHRLGMRWSEEKDQYVGSHEGHFITIAYGSKSEDNHIYVYIRYAEEK